jgi:hypothetical protein
MDFALIPFSVSYKLKVTRVLENIGIGGGPLTFFEQELTNVTPGMNTHIVNNNIKNMLDQAAPGDRFHGWILATYEHGDSGESYEISYPNTPYVYVPKLIIPNLVVTSPINKDTSVSSFSLIDYITTDSPGALSFSVAPPSYDEPNFAPGIAIDSNGYVTIYVEGTTNILVTQAASADGVYAPATASIELVVSAPPPSPTSMLVANYPFDSDGNDASTNNNHLTNHNTVTFNTVNFRRGTGAALFDGSNYFEIANDGRFSPDNFTVACWIKPVNSAGNYQSIATCRSGFSPNVLGWMIYIAPDNSLQFWTGNYPSWSGPGIHLYSDFGNLNAWVHIAFTFTKSTSSLIMYINGTLTTTVSRSYANNTTTTLRIGAGANESSAQFFLKNGTLLDDFRFYNSVLSASQVNDIYTS